MPFGASRALPGAGAVPIMPPAFRAPPGAFASTASGLPVHTVPRNRFQAMSEPMGRDAAWPDVWSDDDAADAEPAQPLTAAEASALRARLRTPPLWWVPAGQALAGVVMAALAWLVSGRVGVMLSALYGAAAAVVPSAVMAVGLLWSPPAAPAAQVVRWALWEAVKLLLAVGMLALAPRVVVPLSWPALLIALVVCLKVYWLVPLWRGRWK